MKTIKTLVTLFQNSFYRTASVYSSAACYYIILSLLPMSLFILALVSSLSPMVSRLLTDQLPDVILHFLSSLTLDFAPVLSLPVYSTVALTWLWSASKGIAAVTDGMNAVLNHQLHRGFIRQKLYSIGHFILLSISLVVALLALVFGERLILLLSTRNSIIFLIFRHRFIVAFFLLSMIFSVLYLLQKGASLSVRFAVYGGMAASAGWILFSFGFSVYLRCFSNQYELLGNLGGLLIAAIWLRYCILLLFAGIKYAVFLSNGNRSIFRFLWMKLRDVHE